jgi:uncharacterized protein (DUF2345 family)
VNVEFAMPGKYEAKGSTHALLGGASAAASLPRLPQGTVKIEPGELQFERYYHDEEPMAGTPYRALLTDGSVRAGTLDSAGQAILRGVSAGSIADLSFGQMPGAYKPKDQRPTPAHKPSPKAADIDALLDKYSGGKA